jgi:hypothetical protein
MKMFYRTLILFFLLLINTQSVYSQWVQTNGPYGGFVNCIAVSGTNIFAGTTYNGVYLSTDNGTNWTQVNDGLTTLEINALAVSGSNIFAGTGSGIFRSTNNGSNWIQENNGLIDQNTGISGISSIAISGNNIYACGYGVFLSTDNGTNWTEVGLWSMSVVSMVVSGNNIFVGSYEQGLWRSTDNGTSWNLVSNSFTNQSVWSLVISGDNIFAGTYEGGVYFSTDNGTNWTQVNKGLNPTYVQTFAISGMNIFAGTTSGVFLSTNNGTNWVPVNNGLTNSNVQSLAVIGNNILAGTYGNGVYLLENIGTDWTQVHLTDTDVDALSISGINIFASTFGSGVYLSTDNGTNWAQVNNGLRSKYIFCLAANGTYVFAGTGYGVFLSTNNGITWNYAGLSSDFWNITALSAVGTNIFAGITHSMGGPGMVFLSTNNGTNWTQIYSLSHTRINCISVSGANIFIGTSSGIFLSTNKGTNWTQVNNGLTDTTVNALSTGGTNIYAGTNSGVFLSTNNGSNWTQVNNGLTNTNVHSFAVIGNNIFSGTAGGVFLSTNSGTNWTMQGNGLASTTVSSLTTGWNNIFAGTNGVGVFRRPLSEFTLAHPLISISSPNGGEAWEGNTIHNITWLEENNPSNIKIDLSTDGGINWIALSIVPPGKGTFNWTIPPFPCTTTKVRVSSVDFPQYASQSAQNFTMTTNSTPVVYVTSPNGGDIFKAGSIQNITWTASPSIINIKIELTTDKGATWNPVANSVSAFPGTYSWTVPSTSSRQCQIRISDTSDSTFYDISDNPFIIWQVVAISQNPVVDENHLSFGSTNILIDLLVLVPVQITTSFYEYEDQQSDSLPSGINKISHCYWTISAPGISFQNGYIKVPVSTLGGVNNSANLVWLKRINPGDAWTNIGGSLTDGNLVNTTAFTSFSEFAIGTTGDDPLPVQLANFLAKQDKGNVFLNWETKTEIQNAGFDIERKTEKDKQFIKVGFIKGRGNSNTPAQYKYSDNTVQGGKIFYRLGQINTNGLVTYSKEIEINVIPTEYILCQNYPNPFNPSTKISYTLPVVSKVTLEVYNITGEKISQLVNEEQPAGYYYVDFSSSTINKSISSGVYYYRITASDKVTGNNFSSTKKMILLK